MEPIQGIQYRLANNWLAAIPVADKPLNYLEVGVLCGANAVSVEKVYGAHPGTRIICIDPWDLLNTEYEEDYNHAQNHQHCLENIRNTGNAHKFTVIKGFSHLELPKLPDEFFDIIYLDGNHNPENVLEDAVLAFRKLKVGGYLIFDDYGWGGPDLTKRGIDAFLSGYHRRIKILGELATQVFLQRTL